MSEKCPEIHISFNISATNADIVLKLKIVLNHHRTNSYTNLHNSDLYFDKIIALFRLRKCPEIHISFNISATNADIVLKLKIVLNHHRTNSYTNLHNSDLYFDKIIALFRLRKCPEIHISFNISATNADIVLKLKIVLNHHRTNSYTNLHNSDLYFDKIIALFRLRKCQKMSRNSHFL